jgi:hypothetical protein
MKSDEKIEYLRQSALQRRELLQEYMTKHIQGCSKLNSTFEVYEFLEISALSLIRDMGWKGKEGYVSISVTKDERNILGIKKRKFWAKHWAFIRESYIAICETIGSTEPSDVFLFDPTFFVHQKDTSVLGVHGKRIIFGNSRRKIEIKSSNSRDMIDWLYDFQKVRIRSPWVTHHRFGSFAPEREDIQAKMYIDGKDYFHAVSDGILAARREIYICDWWLSPELVGTLLSISL